jgi:hypothetical protein
MMPVKSNTLCKKKLIKKQKYVTQDTAVQNNRKQFKSSTANEKIERLKRKPLGKSIGKLKDHEQVKKNSRRGYVAQV